MSFSFADVMLAIIAVCALIGVFEGFAAF